MTDMVPLKRAKRAEPMPEVGEAGTAPLREALCDVLAEDREIAKMLMQRLVSIAATAKPNESLRAMELMFDRLDGPLMKEIQDAITPIQVTLQNIHLKARHVERLVEAENGGPALED